MKSNTKGLIAYAFGVISGLILLFTEKEDKFVKFHAAQSTVLSLSLYILKIFLKLVLGAKILGTLLGVFTFILCIVCMIKAYKGETFELPIVGEWAKKLMDMV